MMSTFSKNILNVLKRTPKSRYNKRVMTMKSSNLNNFISRTGTRFLSGSKHSFHLYGIQNRKYHTTSKISCQNTVDELPIFELSPETFRDQLASSQTPLIVQFYVPESEACDTMYEMLAQKVYEYKGSLRLGRLDVERHSGFAGQLNISQVPAVFGFYMGQPIANFVGVPPEDQLEQFVDMLLKFGSHKVVSELLDEANELLEADKVDEAMEKFQEILNNPTYKAESIALSGLARCFLKKGEIQNAEELVDIIQEKYPRDLGIPEVVKAISALEIAKGSSEYASSLTELEEKIKEDDNDLQLKYDYANALWGAGRRDDAIDQLLTIIKRDKEWNDQAARKFLVKIFESLGPDHPSTVKGRKRFSNIWFS